MYRSPNGEWEIFFNCLSNLLENFDISNKIVVAGDFNFDFNHDTRDVCQCKDYFASFGMLEQVSLPVLTLE